MQEPVQIPKKNLPGVTGFALGLPEGDEFFFAEDRDAVNGKNLPVVIGEVVFNLEIDSV